MTPALIDCTVRFRGPGDYRYSATFRIAGQDVRVRACRDDDRGTAFAVAESLDDALRWRQLLQADPPARPRQLSVVGELEHFARELAACAHAVPPGVEAAR
jgi:hypothetical protein